VQTIAENSRQFQTPAHHAAKVMRSDSGGVIILLLLLFFFVLEFPSWSIRYSTAIANITFVRELNPVILSTQVPEIGQPESSPFGKKWKSVCGEYVMSNNRVFVI
jgi:hypothetical protein